MAGHGRSYAVRRVCIQRLVSTRADTFVDGAFQAYGTYQGAGGTTLTVSYVASAVPGPAAALPFALMALRRRKRA